MTDPISVLLIIGAAVVGPIDGKPINYETVIAPGYQYCLEGGNGPDRCTYRKISDAETLPQLCERAMREIGAEKFSGTALILGNETVKITEEWRLKDQVVRCIPTPTGYRK